MALSQAHQKLLDDGNKLFTDRTGIESFWQAAAENFYPEVATFTGGGGLTGDFGNNLTTSYPQIVRRTLGDTLSALLRPVQLDTSVLGIWFAIRSSRETIKDIQAQRWLEFATKIQRKAMYDRKARFVRATKEGDHFFATFGQCVLSIELNRNRDTLLYRNWHIKDVVWCENAEGEIDHVQRKWKPTASQLASHFPGRVSPKVTERLKDSPYETVECRHVVISSETYNERIQGKKARAPWISLWIDVDNKHVMEEAPVRNRIYIIPRWVTVPGSQYAVSPAVTIGLPDARLLQSMTLTMLEASEKYANPPMLATEEVVRSDLQYMAGGTTWVDREYDERTGEAVRPLYMPNAGQGLNAAFEQGNRIEQALAKAFFLDSLSLPPATVSKEMTRYEVEQRVSEWLRRAMPIFEPMEFEYNAAICEETFDLLMNNGAFGSIQDIPQSLRGSDIQFKFESPLHEGAERRKGMRFMEATEALLHASQLDQTVRHMLDVRDSMREVMSSMVPANWQNDDAEMDRRIQAEQQQQATMQALAAGTGAAEIADKLGSAVKNVAQAQQPKKAA